MLICWESGPEGGMTAQEASGTAAAHQGGVQLSASSGSRFLLLAAFTIAIHGGRKRQTNFLLAVSPLFQVSPQILQPSACTRVAHPNACAWCHWVMEYGFRKGRRRIQHWWKDWPWLGWRDLLLTQKAGGPSPVSTNIRWVEVLIAGSWKAAHPNDFYFPMRSIFCHPHCEMPCHTPLACFNPGLL